jgi:hypothetical protein
MDDVYGGPCNLNLLDLSLPPSRKRRLSVLGVLGDEQDDFEWTLEEEYSEDEVIPKPHKKKAKKAQCSSSSSVSQ